MELGIEANTPAAHTLWQDPYFMVLVLLALFVLICRQFRIIGLEVLQPSQTKRHRLGGTNCIYNDALLLRLCIEMYSLR